MVFHVAQRGAEGVAPASFIAAQLAAANSIYGPLGIELVEHERVSLADKHAELVTRADRDALAHELGHLFGNRKHSNVPGNLMSYQRAEGPPFLDEAQVGRVRSTLAALIKAHTLVPLAAAPSAAATSPSQPN